MRPALALLLLVACKDDPPPPPPSTASVATVTSTTATRKDLLGRCQICHSLAHIEQQRLTPTQWAATVKKMVGWGAPLGVTEAEALVDMLAASYPPDLADAWPRRVPTPSDALPEAPEPPP